MKVLGFFYATSEYLLQRKKKNVFYNKIPKKSLLLFLKLRVKYCTDSFIVIYFYII